MASDESHFKVSGTKSQGDVHRVLVAVAYSYVMPVLLRSATGQASPYDQWRLRIKPALRVGGSGRSSHVAGQAILVVVGGGDDRSSHTCCCWW